MNPDESRQPGRFDNLPPSCKYVYYVVAREGPLRRQELIDQTTLPSRTVDEALERLENCDYLHRTRDSGDLRQVVCKIDD